MNESTEKIPCSHDPASLQPGSEIWQCSPGRAIAASILVFLCLVSSFVWVNRDFLGSGFLPSGDSAAVCLGVLEASRFERTLGPYSKFQFHHPGPAGFYLLAGTMKIFTPFLPVPGAITAAQFLIKAAMLAAAFLVASTLFAGFSYGLMVLACYWAVAVSSPILASPSMADLLGSLWNPENTSPYLLMTLSAAAMASGRVWAAPLLAFPFVLSLQNHLSTLPVAAAMGSWGFACLFLERAGPRKSRKYGVISGPEWTCLALTALFLIVCFIPPAIEVFERGAESNPALIAERAFSNGAETLGISRAASFVLGVAASPFLRFSAASTMGFACLTIFAAWMAGKAMGVKSGELSGTTKKFYRVFFAASIGFGAAVAGASSLRITPDNYMILSILGLSAALLFCCVFLASYVVRATLPAQPAGFFMNTSSLGVICPALVLCGAAALFPGRTISLHPTAESMGISDSARQVLAGLKEAMPSGSKSKPLYLVASDDGGFQAMAAVFNSLAWEGREVMTPHNDIRIGQTFWHPPETLDLSVTPATVTISGNPGPGTRAAGGSPDFRWNVHFRITPPPVGPSPQGSQDPASWLAHPFVHKGSRTEGEGDSSPGGPEGGETVGRAVMNIDSAVVTGPVLEIQGWGFMEGLDPRTQKSWILFQDAGVSEPHNAKHPANSAPADPTKGRNGPTSPWGAPVTTRFRPDLARHFGDPSFAEAGFCCRIKVDALPGGIGLAPLTFSLALGIENGKATATGPMNLVLKRGAAGKWNLERGSPSAGIH